MAAAVDVAVDTVDEQGDAFGRVPPHPSCCHGQGACGVSGWELRKGAQDSRSLRKHPGRQRSVDQRHINQTGIDGSEGLGWAHGVVRGAVEATGFQARDEALCGLEDHTARSPHQQVDAKGVNIGGVCVPVDLNDAHLGEWGLACMVQVVGEPYHV